MGDGYRVGARITNGAGTTLLLVRECAIWESERGFDWVVSGLPHPYYHFSGNAKTLAEAANAAADAMSRELKIVGVAERGK
jgi:hypothetical protein